MALSSALPGLFRQPIHGSTAIVTVVKEELQTTVHRICLFHFVQANYRYITENCGLTIPYRGELDIQSLLRRFWRWLSSRHFHRSYVSRLERRSRSTSGPQRQPTSVGLRGLI